MAFFSPRRAFLAAGAAGFTAIVLAACGGGESVVSKLVPTRAVAFGDGFSDVGQIGGRRYTINDGSVNNWTQQVAAAYNLPIAPVSAGGTSYATGNARITNKPDAAGNAATRSVQEQVDAFLATGSFAATDLVMVGAGTADIVVEITGVAAGRQTADQAVENAYQAGVAYAAQIRRLTAAGAKAVVVTGPYNLGRSPWAIGINQTALAERASTRFNDALLINIVDEGANVLYVDAALYFNLVTGTPAAYQFATAVDPACTSLDAGPGIGIGTGQVNSALCNGNTLQPNAAGYVFADRIYPTPVAHRLFGDFAAQRARNRF